MVAVLLNLYMRKCGGYRTALGHQMLVMRQLETVALAVGQADSKEKRLQVLRERLAQTDFPSSFQLPHTPNIKVRGIVVEKCRVMESKKKPLWLVFENADPKRGRVTVMFKCGDDLRQDQLTLQILALMDRLWKQEGLDLHMSAYKCISTGNEIGMLEIVGNSATLANIVASARDDPAGGRAAGDTTRKLMAAMDALYRDDVLINWLALNNVDFLRSRRVNETNQDQDRLIDHRRHAMSGPSSLPDPRNNAQYIKPASGSDVARQNFLLSCAGQHAHYLCFYSASNISFEFRVLCGHFRPWNWRSSQRQHHDEADRRAVSYRFRTFLRKFQVEIRNQTVHCFYYNASLSTNFCRNAVSARRLCLHLLLPRF